MQIKRITAAIIALLIFIPCAAMAADNTTKALVQFKDGDLIIEDVDEQGAQDMDAIDFGEHTLPAKAEKYTAKDDKDYTLRITDARSATKAWKLTVKMGKFVSTAPASEFKGTITLAGEPVKNPSKPELTVNKAVIVSDAASGEKVLDATAALGRGVFDTVWNGKQIELAIDDYLDVEVASYEATLTWQLGVGP